MQEANKVFYNTIHDRLKTGDIKKPVIKVEIDRLMFVPGDIQQFSFEKMVEKVYTETVEVSTINQVSENVYEGYTSQFDEQIQFPINGKTLTEAINSGAIGTGGYFGMRNDPITKKRKMHKGLDFGYPAGTEVVAAWNGIVSYAGNRNNGYGNMIQIIHSFAGSQLITPIKTTYAHLSAILVTPGQSVKRGDVIGKVGTTGQSTGNHLHFEIMENADGKLKNITYFAGPNPSSAIMSTADDTIDVGKAYDFFNKGKIVDPLPYLKSIKTVSRSYSSAGNGTSSTQVNSSSRQRIFYSNTREPELLDSWKNGNPIGYDENKTKVSISVTGDVKKTFFSKQSSAPSNYQDSQIPELGSTKLSDDPNGQRADFYRLVTVGTISSLVLSKPNPTTTSSFSISFNVDLGGDAGMASLYGGFMNGSTDRLHDFDGDELRIFANGELRARHVMSHYTSHRERNFSAGLPQGTTSVKFVFINGSNYSTRWNISDIAVDRLFPSAQITSEEEKISLQKVTRNEIEIVKKTEDLYLGSFRYLDSIELNNVMSVSIDSQYELYANQATVTLANPDGYYSPYFNSYWFPELGTTTPFSYDINGVHMSVLSENTPIRIYMGYGDDLIRVFTGFIDKVDVQSEGVIAFTCRDTCKILIEKVLTEDKKYPDEEKDKEHKDANGNLPYWTKSAIVQDLIAHTTLLSTGNKLGWRDNSADKGYPDAIIEETYYTQLIKDMKKGKYKYIKAVAGQEAVFDVKDFSQSPKIGINQALNPFVEEKGKKFVAYSIKVIDAITEIIKDTGMRIYADRYGTVRLEKIDLKKPISYVYTESENLMSLNQTIDFSRGRSHIVVRDKDGNTEHFTDNEIYAELKGEIRTLFIYSEWAKTSALKKTVATYAFFDMKRLCRTIQVTVPLNPLLDPLDRIWVVNSKTSTRSVYIIKGIKTTFSQDGATQTLDLMWSEDSGELME